MKKILFVLTILFMLITANVRAEQILGIGDSIMAGAGGAAFGPLPTLGSYLSMTYHNSGVSSTCIDTGNTNISSWLTTYSPSRVYDNYGINDIRTWADTCHSPYATWIAYKENIRAACASAGATYYAMQITPDKLCSYDGANDASGTIKLWNAYLEDWAYTNSIPMTPTYQDLSDTSTDDALNASWTSDGIHPNSTGDVVYGYLMYHSGVPTRARDWGSSSYPTMGHESFSWWVITGTGSVTGGSTDAVTGYNDGGTLSLSQNASAVNDVLSVIVPSGNVVSISSTVSQGAVTTYYRTSASNFTRASAGSWTTYTGSFSMPSGHYFIQIKLATSGATTALIDDITLDWSNAASVTTSTPGGTFGWH